MGIIEYLGGIVKKDDTLTIDDIKDIFYRKYNIYKLTNDDYNSLLALIYMVCFYKNYLLDDFKLLECGQDAIVFEVKDSIVKVTTCFYHTNSLSEFVSYSKFILKPNIELSCTLNNKRFTVLEFDKLNVKNIKWRDVIVMYIHLREDGYLWYDPKRRNLGKDSFGGLYLIDYGQLYCMHGKDYEIVQHELEHHRNVFPELDEAYTNKFCYVDKSVIRKR